MTKSGRFTFELAISLRCIRSLELPDLLKNVSAHGQAAAKEALGLMRDSLLIGRRRLQ